jgi:hypothetical protein
MSNRQWLKELLSEMNWITVAGPLGLDGKHRVETQHTVYLFEDAVCVDIARRDCGREDSSADASMVGMRVVGWLLDVEGRRRLVRHWLPEARAVLWRAPDARNAFAKVALTSPTFEFAPCPLPDRSQALLAVLDDDDDDNATTGEYRPGPLPVIPAAAESASLVRLFP